MSVAGICIAFTLTNPIVPNPIGLVKYIYAQAKSINHKSSWAKVASVSPFFLLSISLAYNIGRVVHLLRHVGAVDAMFIADMSTSAAFIVFGFIAVSFLLSDVLNDKRYSKLMSLVEDLIEADARLISVIRAQSEIDEGLIKLFENNTGHIDGILGNIGGLGRIQEKSFEMIEELARHIKSKASSRPVSVPKDRRKK